MSDTTSGFGARAKKASDIETHDTSIARDGTNIPHDDEMTNLRRVSREFVPPARLRGTSKSLIRDFFDRAPSGSINLGLGEPDIRTPQIITHAAMHAIEAEQNGYTTHAGLLGLRRLVAGDYESAGASAESTIITAGSQEALYLALMTLVDAGDEVLVPDPGFVAYPTMVRMAGGVSKRYRLPAQADFDFDLDEFRQAITPRTKVVIITSPSNPTGRALDEEQLKKIAEALAETGAFVISDEIYRELYFTKHRPPSIADFYPRTIVIGGLSKSLSMTGWRLGWLCGVAGEGDSTIRDAVKAALVLHGYVTTCASTVSQKAALAAWSNEAEAARAGMRRTFCGRRDYMISRLEEINVRAVSPDGAFYVMVDVSAHGASMEIAERALEHKVITVPGMAFGAEGEGYLRLSFCADKDVLDEGVRRLAAALKS
ncbi:MAG: pyridoxal phosphate-dependent aminotransferase [Pyrinomonadaceae bacterium MAG19_C2-C3]|nr:pyridoxal phosphate-dependent aminotransferase [Pyrinomonadaceae bacterium MAG19_C2-C3]